MIRKEKRCDWDDKLLDICWKLFWPVAVMWIIALLANAAIRILSLYV